MKNWSDSQIKQFECEIEWLKTQMLQKKLTQKQRREYGHQIRKKELEIAFNEIK